MRKPGILFLLILCSALFLTSCKGSLFLRERNFSTLQTPSGVVTAKNGFAEGELGDTMQTAFFQFTVLSADFIEDANGYQPAAGHRLVDCVIVTQNTFGDDLEMYDYDFQMQWGGEGEDDYSNPIAATYETMVPSSYTLGDLEKSEYHYIYEVPEGSSSFSVSFLEYFDDGTEGDVFFVYFNLESPNTKSV